eukprot:TRINITY_DN16160_c0_g1_i1.p3 TRINITY_DN16160_c0_g1~~TRINITY_DN16160_c0_g1_i1.p3  ORF type:complete len:113 (+),score=57.72 TRINITY_DN16160_c0_g1_i1:42-341(+)
MLRSLVGSEMCIRDSKKIDSLEQIFLFSMPIKEYQIVDAFISEEDLKDEMLCVQQVQKSTSAGQRTRFKAFQMVGDHNGHIGIGAVSYTHLTLPTKRIV